VRLCLKKIKTLEETINKLREAEVIPSQETFVAAFAGTPFVMSNGSNIDGQTD
jgi:hypothetical protein